MKLIIDIPDYELEEVKNGSIASNIILKAVKNGTPITTDGDLISRNALKEEIEKNKEIGLDKNNEPCIEFMQIYQIKNLIDNAPTVVEADKGETKEDNPCPCIECTSTNFKRDCQYCKAWARWNLESS